MDYPKFSIIIPVKNEAGLLALCLKSLAELDYPKERVEIIVADGLSADSTRDVALTYGAKVVRNDKQIVSSGRNRGFEKSSGDIIAFTDADCVFDAGWLKNAVKYFEDGKIGGVGGATLLPKDYTAFEKAVNFIFSLAEAFEMTSHRQNVCAGNEVKDIPGCNAMYRRQALEEVMPVDENLLTAEDVWMNFCVREAGYKLICAPDVILWHHRRSSPKRFFRQIYRFAIGRLQLGKKNIRLIKTFHIAMGLSLPALILLAVSCRIILGAGLCLIAALAFAAAVILFSFFKTRSLSVSANALPAVVIFIVGWSAGFLRESFFPLKNIIGK